MPPSSLDLQPPSPPIQPLRCQASPPAPLGEVRGGPSLLASACLPGSRGRSCRGNRGPSPPAGTQSRRRFPRAPLGGAALTRIGTGGTGARRAGARPTPPAPRLRPRGPPAPGPRTPTPAPLPPGPLPPGPRVSSGAQGTRPGVPSTASALGPGQLPRSPGPGLLSPAAPGRLDPVCAAPRGGPLLGSAEVGS